MAAMKQRVNIIKGSEYFPYPLYINIYIDIYIIYIYIYYIKSQGQFYCHLLYMETYKVIDKTFPLSHGEQIQ